MQRRYASEFLWIGSGILLAGLLSCGGGGGGGTPAPPAPAISTFTSNPASITVGGSSQLTGTFSNGTGTITPGNLPATSGTPVAVTPTTLGANTYTLTVSGAGGTATATASVTVVAAPQIVSFGADRTQSWAGQSVQLTATFSGGTGSVAPGGLAITSGTPISVTPGTTTTYTLTIANSLGAQVSATVTVNVETRPPSIGSFTASAPVVPMGSPLTFNWTLGSLPTALTLNGVSVLGQTAATLTPPPRRSTFILVASNPLGPDASASVPVAARGMDLLAGSLGDFGFLDARGTGARFQGPLWYSARDAAGNVYVTDPGNRVIRRIAPDTTVNTFAGTPMTWGYADGPLGTARFNNPLGIAVDTAGNLYIGDNGNNCIRKVSPAGVVTTLAGIPGSPGYANGPGATAKFSPDIQGLTVDAAGNLYVADNGTRVIRKVDPTGNVSLLAGTPGISGYAEGAPGAAQFDTLRGLALDGAGNLLVADAGNSLIRRVALAGGTTSTLAGSKGNPGTADGTGIGAQFSWSCGLGTGPDGKLYVADYNSGRIRQVDPATGRVTTLAGTSNGYLDGPVASAQFAGPCALTVLGDGSLLVSDWYHGTVRKIAGGQVSTLAGVYYDSQTADGPLGSVRFVDIEGLGIAPNGDILLCDSGAFAIRRLHGSGVTTLAGTPGTSGYSDGTGSAASFGSMRCPNPGIDAAGNLYVTDHHNTIRKITPGGAVTTLAGTAGSPGYANGTGAAALFFYPRGIAVDPAGNLYVADYGNNVIRKIAPGGVVTLFAGQPGVPASTDGTLLGATFNGPSGLVFDGAGNLYVADYDGHVIRKITPAGNVTTLAGAGGSSGYADGTGAAARFFNPSALAIDAAGNLYVADYYNALVRKVSPAGVVTTLTGIPGTIGNVLGPLPTNLARPTSIALTAQGDLLVGTNLGVFLITAP